MSGSVRHDDNDVFENATTYRATGAYLFPGWGTRLHGSYGTGIKNPTFLDLSIEYNGEQKDRDFSTFPATRVTLDDYTLVNVAGSYVVNQYLTVFARIENLFDDDYEEVLGFRARGIGAFGGVRLNLDG